MGGHHRAELEAAERERARGPSAVGLESAQVLVEVPGISSHRPAR